MGLPMDFPFALPSLFPKGIRNLITDVPGVLVGHQTIHTEKLHTGVTAVFPHGGDLFHQKAVAGMQVLNGFGKSAGLVQLAELGTLEAPLFLTNTLSVGAVLDGAVKYMLRENPDIATTTSTVNCVVSDCNDGRLSDIRSLAVTQEDVFSALATVSPDFEEGSVGGGSGMVCMGFTGGIGSASRIVSFSGENFTVGSLVMTNFGGPGSLVIGSRRLGAELVKEPPHPVTDRGSIVLITGTDLPLSSRQCTRISRRAAIALGRVGSQMGNGSGDISIVFSNGNLIPNDSREAFISGRILDDSHMDTVFSAAIEAMEESILSALWHAKTLTGYRGNIQLSLQDALREAHLLP